MRASLMSMRISLAKTVPGRCRALRDSTCPMGASVRDLDSKICFALKSNVKFGIAFFHNRSSVHVTNYMAISVVQFLIILVERG